MASILDIAKKIKGNCCERLVKYTGQEYVISGGNIGVGTFKLDIASFQNKIKEINAIPPIMMALDNNQYLLCQQASQLIEGSKLKEDCLRIRLMQIMSFTQLQALLSVPPSEEVNQQVVEWIKNMTRLTQLSIELLAPKPVPAPRNWASIKKETRVPTAKRPETPQVLCDTRSEAEPSRKEASPVKSKLNAIMKFQGIKPAEMQDAIDILSK